MTEDAIDGVLSAGGSVAGPPVPLLALNEESRFDRLCELNVVEQVVNVCETTIVEDAWARGQDLTVHGLVYGLAYGLLRDLDMSIASADAAVGHT